MFIKLEESSRKSLVMNLRSSRCKGKDFEETLESLRLKGYLMIIELRWRSHARPGKNCYYAILALDVVMFLIEENKNFNSYMIKNLLTRLLK